MKISFGEVFMSRDTKIKDVKIVRSGLDNREEERKFFAKVETESCIPKNRDAIYLYADEPCVEACQLLYDLNIQTYTSNGHTHGMGTGQAYVGIVYDTLSDENKEIANNMIRNGLIRDITNAEGRGKGQTISLEVPISTESLVGDVSDSLVKLASFFQEQDVLYGRITSEELYAEAFTKLEDGNYRYNLTFDVVSKEDMPELLPEYVENVHTCLYTGDGELYFETEDLYNKHMNYLNKFNLSVKK